MERIQTFRGTHKCVPYRTPSLLCHCEERSDVAIRIPNVGADDHIRPLPHLQQHS